MPSLVLLRQAFEPGLDPPPGVIPDPDHTNKDLWRINIITQSLAMPFVTILVFLRLYAKVWIHRGIGLDDVACFLGWIFAIGYSVIAILMSQHGAGIHQWDVDQRDVVPYIKLVYATMLNYGPCAFFIKSSILLFCAKTFRVESGKYFWAIYGFIALMLAYYLPVLILKSLICRPISLFWDPTSAPDGACFNQRALILADSLISVITDLSILLLPIPLALRLNMATSKKRRIAAVFSAGGIATICSIIRMVDIIKNAQSPDATYVFMRINLWGIAEVNIGLICACLPVLPGLLKQHRARFSSSASHSHTPALKHPYSSSHRSRPSAHLSLAGIDPADPPADAIPLRQSSRLHLRATTWGLPSKPQTPTTTGTARSPRLHRARSVTSSSVLGAGYANPTTAGGGGLTPADSHSDMNALLANTPLVGRFETSVRGPSLEGRERGGEEGEDGLMVLRGEGILKTVEVEQTAE